MSNNLAPAVRAENKELYSHVFCAKLKSTSATRESKEDANMRMGDLNRTDRKDARRVAPGSDASDCTSLSDPELIRACLEKDEGAWKELVNRYARLVYSIPRRDGLSPIDTDEVFQRVFTIVFRQLASLRNHKLLAAWLITITVRETKRVGKAASTFSELDESTEDESTPPLEQVQMWERQHIVRQAIRQLDPPCRNLLTVLFLEKDAPSYEQISIRLGIPMGSIGPTRARCFKKLEALLLEMDKDIGS